MKPGMRAFFKDAATTAALLTVAFGICLLLRNILVLREETATVFVLAVFLVSLLTEGYLFGIAASVLSVLAVNFAFTPPYFSFNFAITDNLVSAVFMIAISLLASALTTRVKRSRAIKERGEQALLKVNLLRAVSHDLRTPLTTVYGASSTILEGYDTLTEEQKRQMVAGIKKDTEWLIRMVENLLSVTRVDGEGVRIIKTPTVAEELLDSVLLKLRSRYPMQRVEVSLPEELITVPMDPLLIEQVLINLLENAIQHAAGMSRLILRVTAGEGVAIFEVEDNGCGIERDRLQRIFTGYYDSAEQSADAAHRHAGIGLSVSAAIIRAHGGTICAENLPSGGALFRFILKKEEEDPDGK